MLGLPLFENRASADVTTYDAAQMLADAVNGRKSHDTIRAYAGKLPGNLDEAVANANRTLQQGGFTNFRQSYPYVMSTHLFYPVFSVDGQNVCMPFFTRLNRDPYVTMIEGPSMLGLALAATAYANLRGHQATAEAFLPVQLLRHSIGNFKNGYSEPDLYRTARGSVWMNYSSHGDGTGTVRVVGDSINPRGTLWDQKYDITYLT